MSKTRPIIILGVDRSGTSMVAEMVWRWGAFGGNDDRLSRGDVKNPQGYFENEQIKPFIEELLLCAPVSEWHPTYRVELQKKTGEPYFKSKALELVAAMEEAGRPWFWKEPDLCLTLAFWTAIWRDPIYVITVRNPYDSSVSMEKFALSEEMRKKYRLITAHLLRWQFFMLSILTEVGQVKDKIFMQYEDLLQNPEEQSRRLCEFLDRTCGVEQPDPQVQASVSQVINPNLWRNRSSRPLAVVPQATREQKALYELLQKKCVNPDEPFSPARYPLYAGWWEYLELVGYVS